MARRKKGAVRKGRGSMCNICGINCGRGGPLRKHVEGAHGISYAAYKTCFYPPKSRSLADAWDDKGTTTRGKTVLIHTLVTRMVGQPGPRGATRSARIAQ